MLNKSANQNQTFTVESLPGRPYATSHRSPPPIRRPPPSKRSRKRRKAKSYMLYYIIIILFCLAVSFVFCYTVFFKVEKIKVVGNEVYSSKEIIDLVDVKVGDSLFQISASSGESRLETKLPYVRDARIVRSLPATLQIQIVEEEPMGAIYSETGFTIVSATGKILQRGVLTPPEGVPTVIGMTDLEKFEIGTYAKDYSNKDIKAKDAPLLTRVILLQQFHEEMKQHDLYDKIDYIDVTDRYNIKAAYDSRVLIWFGTQIAFDQKVQLFQRALEEEDTSNKGAFQGEIDVSQAGRAHTRPIKADKLLDTRGYIKFEPLGDSEDNSNSTEEDAPEDEQFDGLEDGTDNPAGSQAQTGETEGVILPRRGNSFGETTDDSTQQDDTTASDVIVDEPIVLYDSPLVSESNEGETGMENDEFLDENDAVDAVESDDEESGENNSYMITLG